MFGYTITMNGTIPVQTGDISYNNIICSNHMIKKFVQDKIFAETEEYILILDGMILNRKDLISSNNASIANSELNVKESDNSKWIKLLLNLYKTKGETFFSLLRGSFSGALYDKTADKWIIFCDQIGSRFTYYAKVGTFFCCCEVMGYMYEMLKKNGIPYHLSEDNALLLLTYGYMLDDRTLCEEVHKINPGCYITYQNEKIEEHRYYMLNNTPDNNIDEHTAIEMIDNYFRKAVSLEFEKDIESGYNKHCVSLSGGLDCRMTSFVAHDLGFTNQLNLTFSQTNYWDQTIPMQMASDLGHEWLFKSLDDGMWLCDADEVTARTGGNVFYYGTAHGNSLAKYINHSTFGMGHSGQLGDVVIGSFIRTADMGKPYCLGEKALSIKNIDVVNNRIKLHLDLDKERGLLYYRGFHGANNGLQNSYHYNESFSPFYELTFLEKALSIPVSLRQNHNVYKKWVLSYYPKAAKYVWETTGRKISAPVINILGKEVPLANIPSKIHAQMRRFMGYRESPNSKKGMNPIAYYMHHNDNVVKYIEDYFSYMEAIPSSILRDIVSDIYKNGTSIEKIQAISLLSAIKMFYK